MRPPQTLTRWIVASCSILLLLAQVMGLHYHRHVDGHSGQGAQAVELHFEDGGLHVGETRTEHQHDHAAGDGPSHWHLDVESKAMKAGLAKVFVDSLLLPLLLVLMAVMAPAAGMPAPLLRRSIVGRWRYRPYSIRPPSQAPPARAAFA